MGGESKGVMGGVLGFKNSANFTRQHETKMCEV